MKQRHVLFIAGGVILAAIIFATEPHAESLSLSSVDTDGDGVVDCDDQCPKTPAGVDVDKRGCWVVRGVSFAVGKADIKVMNIACLDKVLDVMRDNPELKIEIQGHTDNQGAPAANQLLSEKRARAVYEYFLDKGMDISRISYRGFGPGNPVAPNDTAAGRALNRRVEIMPGY